MSVTVLESPHPETSSCLDWSREGGRLTLYYQSRAKEDTEAGVTTSV